MSESTKLSIFVPCYNHGDKLEETLRSILNQSRQADEVLIYDDGSTDNTRQIMEQYSSAYPAIKCIHHKENKGLTYVVQSAFNTMRHEYFDGICADDPIIDGFFEEAMGCIEENPGIGLCCSSFQLRSQDGETWERGDRLSNKTKSFSPEEFAATIAGFRQFSLPTNSMILRRDAILALGGVNKDLRWHYDWFNALIVAFRYGLCYIPKVYQTVSYDPDSFSLRGQQDWGEQIHVLRSIFTLLDREAFADVKVFFRIPSVISKFGPLLLKVLLERREWHQYLSFDLIEYCLDQQGCWNNTQFGFDNIREACLRHEDVVQMATDIIEGLAVRYRNMAAMAEMTNKKFDLDRYKRRAHALGGCPRIGAVARKSHFEPSFLINEANSYSYLTKLIGKMGQNGFSAVGSLFSDSLLGNGASIEVKKSIALSSRYYDFWADSEHLITVRWLRSIDELPSGIRLAIYGTGRFGERLSQMISTERPDVSVECFFDKVPKPPINGLAVKSPSVLPEAMINTVDCVLLCSIYYHEILPELRKDGVRSVACVDSGGMLQYLEEPEWKQRN